VHITTSLNKDSFEVGEELIETISIWLHTCGNQGFAYATLFTEERREEQIDSMIRSSSNSSVYIIDPSGWIYAYVPDLLRLMKSKPSEWSYSRYSKDAIVTTEDYDATVGRGGTAVANIKTIIVPDFDEMQANFFEETSRYVLSDATDWSFLGYVKYRDGSIAFYRDDPYLFYGTLSNSYTVTKPAAPTVSLTITPETIDRGNSSTLEWSSENVSSCTGTLKSTTLADIPTVSVPVDNNFVGPVMTTGVYPSIIGMPIIGDLTLIPITPTYGWTDNIKSGNKVVSPTRTTTYTITCDGLDGTTVTDEKTVTVLQPLPIIDLSVDRNLVSSGETVDLDWNSSGASSCGAVSDPANNNWSTSDYTPLQLFYKEITPNVAGSQTSSPITENTTFYYLCFGPDGQKIMDSETITVSNLDPSDTDTDTDPDPTDPPETGNFDIGSCGPAEPTSPHYVNQDMDLTVVVTGETTGLSYEWEIIDENLYTPQNLSDQTQTLKFLTTGTKNAKVTVTNTEGLTDSCETEPFEITVNPEFQEQ
jgi:hypothetical protein